MAGGGARTEAAARAYSAPVRLVVAALRAGSGASLPLILYLVVAASDPPVTPPVLIRLVLVLTVLPALVARLIERATAADVEVGDGLLTIRRRDVKIEVPSASIARVAPWAVPLPGPGLSLRLRSGRRLPYGVQVDDPATLLVALPDGAGLLEHPSVAYAHARAEFGRPRWYHRLAKFPLFALGPTAVLFNAHQHIAYGGLLGEYYLLGLGSYLTTFAVYWVTVTIYLVLYAGVLRGVVEAAALVAARVAPSRAARVRRSLELGSRVLYFGGVPVLLLLRFVA